MALVRGGPAPMRRARPGGGRAMRQAPLGAGRGGIVVGKPTVEELGIDVCAQAWQRSGDGDGAIEIAFASAPLTSSGPWILMRVAGDPAGLVLVYDRHEWECFLDGVKNGEFDDAVT